jgi:thiol-disulfide isomerase/thioredoxin
MSELVVRGEEESSPEPPSRWKGWLRDAFVLIGGGLLVWFGLGWYRAPGLPDQAPDFSLTALDGASVTLSSLKGQTVVLNFWATWCGPCKMEMPTLVNFSEKHPEIPVLFVAVDGSHEQLLRYAQSIKLPLSQVLTADPITKKAYPTSTLPTTIIVKKDGSVGGAHGGVIVGPQLWWMAVVRG